MEEEDFSINHLKQLISEEKIPDAKTYVKKYFFKLKDPVMTALKTPSKAGYTLYSQSQITKIFLRDDFGKNTDANFKVGEWFYNKDIDYYILALNPQKRETWINKGSNYLNLFYGFLHKERKEYSTYTEDIKSRVHRIWEHIRIVWCSRNESQFQYVKLWICHLVGGKKLKTMLYLKTIQGIGKGVITEFIRDKVIGRHCVHETKSINCIVGNFNSELMGKTLLILEEIPAETKGQWNSLGNAIKTVITNNVMEIEQKGKDKITIDNYINVIAMTNKNAIKIEDTDRRICILDCSHEHRGNFEYFKSLCDECTNNDTVGEAFYWYCIEFMEQNPNFQSNVLPDSINKKDLIIENLNHLYKFIKEDYVLKNKGINEKFKKFYDDYILYLECKKISNKPSNIEVSKKLNDINIKVLTKGHNIKYVEITKDELLKLYQNKKWISDVDEFDDDKKKEKQPKGEYTFTIDLTDLPAEHLKILKLYM